MPTRRTLGVIGVALTCPCHAVPLLMLIGGTAGTGWLLQHLGAVAAGLVVLFLASLWLLLRPSRATAVAGDEAGCATCDRSTP